VGSYLPDNAIATLSVNEDKLNEALHRKTNFLVTALNPINCYAKAAENCQKAYKEGRQLSM